uniref:Uncharacterized protein n=1 Tax=Ananas comosus var. bracteatus TaxID=296719 RepID=A0A6V7QJ03_ANACO|nr:unnamed protein product [Ananas comosus var. bracteatus]
MEGEDVRKRKGYLNEEDDGMRKLARIAGISEEEDDDDDDEDDDEDKLGIEEGMVAEVMKWLEREITSPSPSSSSSPNPSSHHRHDAAFVTINGNEESCGPSFSDSASTVMASIDTRAAAAWPAPPPTIWPWAAATAGAIAEDEDDGDDEGWLARVLGGPGWNWDTDVEN